MIAADQQATENSQPAAEPKPYISGTLGKKMGLAVESAKTEDGKRTYALKS